MARRRGRAHDALVFDGDVAVAWCHFGTVEELPNIHHRKEWGALIPLSKRRHSPTLRRYLHQGSNLAPELGVPGGAEAGPGRRGDRCGEPAEDPCGPGGRAP